MKTLMAKGAKYGCGRLIDLTREGPVAAAKHGRPDAALRVLKMSDIAREDAVSA